MSSFRIDRIIVPTSFTKKSTAAVHCAADVARRLKAEIMLVHVVEPVLSDAKNILRTPPSVEVKKQALETLKDTSNQILYQYGVKARYKVYTDVLYSGIYRSVLNFNADLIIMGHEHIHGMTEWSRGSNADRISLYSKLPVLSVGNPDVRPVKIILFPFNEDSKTLDKLEQVKIFAKIYDAIIHIAAFRNSDKALNRSKMFLRTKKVAENILKEGIWCSTHLLIGEDYTHEILEFTARLNADLIAVAVYPMKSQKRLFSSSAFKKLIDESNIPVLSIPVT